MAGIIVEQHAHKILPITDRALILERGRMVLEGAERVAAGRSAPARALPRSHWRGNRRFRNVSQLSKKSFTAAGSLSQLSG